MEFLASIFITLILVVDSFLPKASLAKTLGVLPEEASTVLSATDNASATTTATVSVRRENEFKEKAKEIKDERKRRVVEKINENINQNNEKWMNNLTETLNRLSAILEKIKTKTAEAKARGKDTSSLEDAIKEAEETISEAQTAVSKQREKTYTLDISEEKNLGQNVSATVKTFRADVKEVFEKVKVARQTVRNILQTLKELSEGDQ